MNRIRKVKNIYQVLVSTNSSINNSIDSTNSPDNSYLIGNWSDANFKNYRIIELPTLNTALSESLMHPDIDWYRLILNHKHIYNRLVSLINALLVRYNFNNKVQLVSKLLSPEELKHSMFDVALMQNNNAFHLNNNNIISFTIINPFSINLNKIANIFENYREHYNRDDLRIIKKKIIDNKIILFSGLTEFGTSYEIRLIPSLVYQYVVWGNIDNNLYKNLIVNQSKIDSDLEHVIVI
jgi:hypothetical protein